MREQKEEILLEPYDPDWPIQFQRLGQALREALGEAALRIDHIGSTAIPGTSAKPILDLQISVQSLAATELFLLPLQELGFIYRAANPDLTKRYFRESPGSKRTHIHVRQAGSWSEQCALLFRDYLRLYPEDCKRYVEVKNMLAQRFQHDRLGYVQGKSPVVWEIIQRADAWSKQTGWVPSQSDA